MILGVTAVLQLGVVFLTGSVALLADTIHNFGDAGTAIPLWIAFMFARRKPSARFTYGFGRVEDLAGVIVVAIILSSALVAGYQAVDRLLNPQPVTFLGWLAAAGVLGFFGNEAVAVFRIRVGRQINSAALIADGYHARTDGLTSLAVVLGAFGVWLGFPLADPIVGLIITAMIFMIVGESRLHPIARRRRSARECADPARGGACSERDSDQRYSLPVVGPLALRGSGGRRGRYSIRAAGALDRTTTPGSGRCSHSGSHCIARRVRRAQRWRGRP